jgi:hypothetical protein
MEHSGPIATRYYADTIGELESLHYAMTVDRDKKGFPVVMAKCPQRKGPLPDGHDPADHTIELVLQVTSGTEHPGMGACMENPAADK